MPYMRFLSDDGVVITVETDEVLPAAAGPQPVSRGGNAIRQAGATFEEALKPIKKTAATIVAEMRSAFPEPPSELEVSFSVKASFEVNGLTLAKAAGEGTFAVKAVWKG